MLIPFLTSKECLVSGSKSTQYIYIIDLKYALYQNLMSFFIYISHWVSLLSFIYLFTFLPVVISWFVFFIFFFFLKIRDRTNNAPVFVIKELP